MQRLHLFVERIWSFHLIYRYWLNMFYSPYPHTHIFCYDKTTNTLSTIPYYIELSSSLSWLTANIRCVIRDINCIICHVLYNFWQHHVVYNFISSTSQSDHLLFFPCPCFCTIIYFWIYFIQSVCCISSRLFLNRIK